MDCKFSLSFRLKYMEAVSQICDTHLTDNFEFGQNITDNEITDLLRKMAPSFKETMFLCKFRNKQEFCKDYFEEILTDEGLCFTFNMVNDEELYREEYEQNKNSKNINHWLITNPSYRISADFRKRNRTLPSSWSLDSGYEQNINDEMHVYPYRVFGAGARAGLFVLLRLYEQNLDYICKGPVQGFKILLHQPGEFV